MPEKFSQPEEKITPPIEQEELKDLKAKEKISNVEEKLKLLDIKNRQMLAERLRDADLDWLEINLDKINFQNEEEVREVERRLDLAARAVVEKNEPKITVGEFFRKNKFMLPFAMAASILLNQACRNPENEKKPQGAGAVYEQVLKEIQEAKKDGIVLDFYGETINIEDVKNIDVIRQWKNNHPDVARVNWTRSVELPPEEKSGAFGVMVTVTYQAIIEVRLQDGSEKMIMGLFEESRGSGRQRLEAEEIRRGEEIVKSGQLLALEDALNMAELEIAEHKIPAPRLP